MFDGSVNRDRLKILSFLLLVFVALLGGGYWTDIRFGGAGLTILNLAVSGVLSAALVILYFRQSSILESQKDLITQELNREARQQHTETLRERVIEWHGDPGLEGTDIPFGDSDFNFPTIARASFRSAPTGMSAALNGDEPFQVIPDQLQGDRYLADLLENHAPDLRETAEEIERLHDEFTTLQEEFREKYDDGVVERKSGYTIEPDEFLSKWIFQLVVMEERDRLGGFDDIRDRAMHMFEEGRTSVHDENEPIIWI